MNLIYDYKSPEAFLHDFWLEKKKKNPKFTIRAWALQMGIKSHANFYEMLQGKRKIPKSLIPKLVEALELNYSAGLFFENLVDYSRSATDEEKTLYETRMRTLTPSRGRKIKELESSKILQDPLHCFINELVLQNNFRPELTWIQSKLGYKVSLSAIEDALNRLLKFDLLREDAQGRLQRVDHLVYSKSDITDRALREYHKSLMDLGKLAIEAQEVLEREFQGMTLNFDPKNMAEAKKDIRAFVASFTEKYDTPKVQGEEIYQLSLQFFGITKNINKATAS